MSFLSDEQLAGHKIVQIAFVVDDLEAAALTWVERFGAGPFFVHDEVPVGDVRDAVGRPAVLEQGNALGQWGSLMVELVKWHNLEPGMMTETMGRKGFNHIAYFASDSDGERDRLVNAGTPLVASLSFGDARVHYHDAVADHGFVIEHYPCVDAVELAYRKVAEAANGWTGENPVRGPLS